MGLQNKVAEAIRNMYATRSGWDFCPPPECPVFCPTEEEFKDPLRYVGQIRHVAEKTGICKIIPPEGWQPPFSLDVDKLKFTPRIQKLCDLEGVARIKAHFLAGVRNYWTMKGRPFRTPRVEGKRIDLFGLYRLVKLEGGPVKCTEMSAWRKVASLLGHAGGRAADLVRDVYETVVMPYDDFVSGNSAAPERPKGSPLKSSTGECRPVRRDYRKPKGESAPKTEIEPIVAEKDPLALDAETVTEEETKTEVETKPPVDEKAVEESAKCARELRRLACYGAGPKMPGLVVEEDSASKRKKARIEYPKEDDEDGPADEEWTCVICGTECFPEDLVQCSCGDSYHLGCANPPQTSTLAKWRCAPCLAEDILRPPEPFGFAQAEREYTLQEFGEMADSFKRQYFNSAEESVPEVVVEKEFWRIICSTSEDVTVEYGADLHSMDHGSGFPTSTSMNLFDVDREYAESGWNLNNLPVLKGSVLRFMNAEISGMTVPWMYVGMCFSAFCWHYEDHWSYSINFLHWGEPKTWYGVPGDGAELLEETMKAAIPELFHSQPDLLHQLVTVMNPNVLMEAGVPVFRTDQKQGEFIVTFPRSYHAGFNQGYNFAEAVNFAPPDWLPLGRESVTHYKGLKRFCVFSHEELVCRIASVKEELDLPTVLAAFKELQIIVENETKLRGALATRGVSRANLRKFEIFSDDERVCDFCKTTCFMSSLYCDECKKMVCLDHSFQICECSAEKLTLQYRFNLDELHVMLKKLKARIIRYDRWANNTKFILSPTAPTLNKATKIKTLVEEAEELHIPNSYHLLKKLKEAHSATPVVIDPEVVELDD